MEKIRAYILEYNENGQLTNHHFWDDNCMILEVLNDGQVLKIKSSIITSTITLLKIPVGMQWGDVDGMSFNYRSWDNEDALFLVNYHESEDDMVHRKIEGFNRNSPTGNFLEQGQGESANQYMSRLFDDWMNL